MSHSIIQHCYIKYKKYIMNIEEIQAFFTIDNLKQYTLIIYIIVVYYGIVLVRWYINSRKEQKSEYYESDFNLSDFPATSYSYSSDDVDREESVASGETIISEFSRTGKYVWDGHYLKKFSGIKLFEFDGEYIRKFSGTGLYTWRNNKFEKFGGTAIYSVSGNAISKFSGTKLWTFDSQGISKFSGTRKYSFEGNIDVPPAIIIMIAEHLEGL